MDKNEMRSIMKEEMKGLEERMMKTFKALLIAENSKMKELITEQNVKIKKLEEDNRDLAKRLSEMEQYSRRSNIQINNVPMVANESLEKLVCEMGQKIGVPINFKTDIQAAHRIPTASTAAIKPIIVKFTNRNLRNSFLVKAKTSNSHQAAKVLSLAQISNVYIKPLVMEKNPVFIKPVKLKPTKEQDDKKARAHWPSCASE
ncbi:hypothetical protein M8J76_005840 [Diaphorina citri]|nr:hypothetical protein M8J75_008323 [Diaphorina citri]KAI5736657.1 hypothetical protein M8J76_005840 [Diaphorina citri]KAI5742854.1 hypothetical protein M8J77_011940 [Diaphorina citri]